MNLTGNKILGQIKSVSQHLNLSTPIENIYLDKVQYYRKGKTN